MSCAAPVAKQFGLIVLGAVVQPWSKMTFRFRQGLEGVIAVNILMEAGAKLQHSHLGCVEVEKLVSDLQTLRR